MPLRMTVSYNKKPCYDIVITDGFKDLPSEIESLELGKRKICVVTDSNVDPLYGEEMVSCLKEISAKCVKYVFPAGEDNKTLDNIKELYKFLIEEDILVALGGGVVGDMTGYAAATYLRGIDFIQIPTTLLAQVDSSVGGKTGVDFDGYKNMIGAFKMPRLVYMNMSTIKTLPDRQYFSGFAEVMKYGLIRDEFFYTWLIDNLYEICEKDPAVLEEMISRSCDIKRAIVEKDPTEKGERALLNFGHTIGHAIEKYMDFTLYHGECVALGCVCAAFISWKKDLLTKDEYYEIRDMFVPFNLPISVDKLDMEKVLELTKSDKKMDAGHIRFILLKKIGKAVIDDTVSDSEILDALSEINFDEENGL